MIPKRAAVMLRSPCTRRTVRAERPGLDQWVVCKWAARNEAVALTRNDVIQIERSLFVYTSASFGMGGMASAFHPDISFNRLLIGEFSA